jgi:Ca2+-binding RTX toxin-like protein
MRQRSNRFLTSLAVVAALSLTAATIAMAARIVGDASSNVLTGTDQRDHIVARGGDDTVNALAARDLVRGGEGNDTIDGGRGCDRVFGGLGDDTIEGGPGFSFHRFRCERLHGGVGNDVSNGGPGRDFMSGGQGDDTQSGGPGADKIFANPGRDRSDGGDGRDVLWALARADVAMIGDPEGDDLTGGTGADRFRVRDGELDSVHCGEGRDRVIADQFDQVDNDCDRVIRRDITSLDQVEDQEENRTENPSSD